MIGLDLSLTAPALCLLPEDWAPGDWSDVSVGHTRPKAPKNDDILGQMKRYVEIAEWVCSLIPRLSSQHSVWIEGYAFSMNNSQSSKLMELGGVVRVGIFQGFGIVPQTVAASAARKLFFGNRKLPKSNVKQAVQLALFNEVKAPRTWTEDEADAFVIANYGLSRCGGTALVLE